MAPRQFYSDNGEVRKRGLRRSDSELERGMQSSTTNDEESNSSTYMDADDDTNSTNDNGIPLSSSSSSSSPSSFSTSPTGAWLHPTISLPILVFVDMFAVSLVVPLLFQYYKNAGVTNANQRELLSSVFSSSQIVGGVILGALADAHWIRRKTILFLSFGGSSIAYALIVYGGFTALIVSRILVGLVKQTMTVSSSMLTHCTKEQNRAKYMGRLQSSSTAAWIAGPSVGALLYKYVNHKAPALLACTLFIINMMLAAIFLRDDEDTQRTATTTTTTQTRDSKTHNSKSTLSFWEKLKSCFSSKALGSVILSTMIFSWVNQTTSYSNMGSYYEDMYGVEPHHRGYIQSYQKVLGFTAQSLLIEPTLQWIGGERRAICFSVFVVAVATFLETQQSLSIFLTALAPAIALSTTTASVSLQALLTHVAPTESISSVFAALDVLQSATAVTVPFYRTILFSLLGGGGKNGNPATTVAMAGDPDPVNWVLSSGLHWIVATLVLSYLLLLSQQKGRASRKAKRYNV